MESCRLCKNKVKGCGGGGRFIYLGGGIHLSVLGVSLKFRKISVSAVCDA